MLQHLVNCNIKKSKQSQHYKQSKTTCDQICFMQQGPHSDKKIQDIPKPPWKIFQDLFVAHKMLKYNIRVIQIWK